MAVSPPETASVTIFLDEVGLLPEGLQNKLLKAIEEREVRRLGSTRSEPVDVWILTATSEDLAMAMREQRFHEALYHRLSVLRLWLPPLRERGQDIVVLAEHSLSRACADYGLPPKVLTPDAQAIPLLEQAVQQWSQFRVRQQQGGLTAFLAEAYLLNGHIEKAQELALQGLELTRDTKFRYGVGLAQRALGRIAQASGAFSEAEVHLNEALQTFTSIQAQFEAGRTHLALAGLAQNQGNREALTTHLKEAHHLFRVLQVPKYVERAEQLAREFGVPL